MTEPAPLVSVGLPVYNGERFVRASLESLSAQTFEDLEIVVIDNASTDATFEIVSEIAASDPRIRVLSNTENIGAAGNYNRAVHESRGRYFKWAAHDDRHEPTFVERCVDVLRADPSISVVYTVTVDVDADDRIVRTYRAGQYATQSDPVERAADIILRPSPCYETFGLVRREVLARTSLIGPYTSSDRPFLLELALMGPFAEIDEPLFFHRQHAARSVHSFRKGRDRKAWFDPKATGRSYPVWRLGLEYHRAAARARISRKQVAQIDGLLARWALMNRGRLMRESVKAAIATPAAVAERRGGRSSVGEDEADGRYRPLPTRP